VLAGLSYFTSMKLILTIRLLVLLQFIEAGPAVVTSLAQPSKPAQALPVHTIRIREDYAAKKADSGSRLLLNSVQLENKADTAFVEKTWSEDMGTVYAVGYTFKKNTPNGIYRFIINDTISTETVLVNGMREGMQKSYMDGRLWEETPYHLDKSNGYGYSYSLDSPYALDLISYNYENDTYFIRGINAAGEVISRIYFMPGDGSGGPYRREEKEYGWSDLHSFFTRDGIKINDAIPRNGLYELVGIPGKYQLFFKNNYIEWWKWFDKDNKLIVEVHAQPGQRL
jgi:hypothetical protein